jgi:hypothetical protein
MTDRTASRVPSPRTPTGESAPRPEQTEDTDPAGLTTFTAALSRWKASQAAPGTPPAANTAEDPGPQLLHDRHLPPPPNTLPSLPALQNIAQATADRARRLLDGHPLPETALTDAVHMAATAPGIDTTTAYRLNIDVGHWRDLVTAHRTGGCTAVRALTGNNPTEPA